MADREKTLDQKIDDLDKRAEALRSHERNVEELKDEIRQIKTRQQEQLEKIAKLTKAEAVRKTNANDRKRYQTRHGRSGQ